MVPLMKISGGRDFCNRHISKTIIPIAVKFDMLILLIKALSPLGDYRRLSAIVGENGRKLGGDVFSPIIAHNRRHVCSMGKIRSMH